MELWHYGALIAAGIIGGAINVMAGGGSVITVPVMVFLGVPGPIANGTNRIAILAQNLIAVGTFMRGGQGDFRLSISLALCALPGALAWAPGRGCSSLARNSMQLWPQSCLPRWF